MISRLPNLDEWVEMVRPHFEFLVERGFHVTPVLDEPALAAWGPRVRYISDTIGVQVHCSVEYNRVETSIIRLLDGRVPPYPMFIRDGDEVYWFHLGGLLALCDPGRRALDSGLTGLDAKGLLRQLAFVASTLSDLDGDLLDPGSNTIGLRQAEIHEQVRAHPPTIKIHVPAGTPADEVTRLVGRSRENFPSIDIEVHRYRR